jgi:hypothetical protein
LILSLVLVPSTLSLSSRRGPKVNGCLVLRAALRDLKKEKQPFDKLRVGGEGKVIQNFSTRL